jgi:hypothetical protein
MARPASIHEATTPHHLVTPAEQCLASCGGAKDAPGPVRLAALLSSRGVFGLSSERRQTRSRSHRFERSKTTLHIGSAYASVVEDVMSI